MTRAVVTALALLSMVVLLGCDSGKEWISRSHALDIASRKCADHGGVQALTYDSGGLASAYADVICRDGSAFVVFADGEKK